ncbi:type IV pilus assembly protein PilF (plasmid) [Legionella adelaidensis]|uniref:Fimbrial biogenesis and twitching motility protein PilF n=1 Tax=Legionella adelaidensis TaxID=45056 RepID=A0A0W0R1R5_9GAMM|nr:type IV pilus biogenesis/stability protein PilW [Legionella adelaidensis]KTC64970.1 fimbrial biogenesis and twitching motility protein PilF [Legionella adelaidensis]VEH85350.1 type IV pilus assembly protein PilF [Legionella adelaidensis]
MLKLRRFLSVLSCFLLISCQHNNEANEDNLSKKYNRDNAAAYNTQLGLAYLKQGNRPRAKKKLLMALKEAPDSANANAAMGYFLEKSAQYKDAEVYYKKAISLSQGSGAQLNNFGTYLCRRGQYRQAEEYFLKAVKDMQYENTAGAYENAGLCVTEIPDLTQAAVYFNKALDQDPTRKQSLYELLKIEIKQDKTKEALATIAKYPTLALKDEEVLTIGAEAARKEGNADLEARFLAQLNQLKYAEIPE